MTEDQGVSRRRPTAEQIEEAGRRGDAWYRPVREVRTLFEKRFTQQYPIDCIYLLHQIDVDYRAYIFFNEDSDISECERNGVTKMMQNFIIENLEEFSDGKRDKITVAFEFDSRENVQKNFGGSYLDRIG